jgi:hypothetical protein
MARGRGPRLATGHRECDGGGHATLSGQLDLRFVRPSAERRYRCGEIDGTGTGAGTGTDGMKRPRRASGRSDAQPEEDSP